MYYTWMWVNGIDCLVMMEREKKGWGIKIIREKEKEKSNPTRMFSLIMDV